MIKPIVMEKDNPESWFYMPQLLMAIKTFCMEHHLDHDANQLADLYLLNFVSPEPMMLAVIGVDGPELAVHCLAGIDEMMGKRFLTVIQYGKKNNQDLTKVEDEVHKCFAQICMWGKSRGADTAQLLTHSERLVAYFERKFGFKRTRTLMRRPI